MKHDLHPVPRYEDLAACDRCNCAEGTLPTDCPGVQVPGRVQNLIINGVVDFVGDRWVGVRKPQVFVIRLGFQVNEVAQAFRDVGAAFKRAGQAIADFGAIRKTSRDVALERLHFITLTDRRNCR